MSYYTNMIPTDHSTYDFYPITKGFKPLQTYIDVFLKPLKDPISQGKSPIAD